MFYIALQAFMKRRKLSRCDESFLALNVVFGAMKNGTLLLVAEGRKQ